MTAADFQAPDAPGFRLDPRVIGAFARFAGGYWRGGNAVRAWTLTLGLAAALLLSTAATVALNHWNRWFFDALERRDVETVTHAVFVFALIIVAMAAIGVLIVLARETLQVRWRAWIVEHLVNRWLGKQRFYHLNVSGKEPPNPEYRISDDTRWATEPLVDLGIGLVLAIAGAAAFISILWSVGGAISVGLGSWGTLTIPAYMVWVALAYGSLASGLMLWIGAPLVGYVGRKNEAEGYFRFAMMRIRDNAESVALMDGGRYEQAILGRFYDTVVARWLAIVWQHGHLTWITNSCGPMKPIVPLLFLAPKYLSGDLTLGQVTQLAAAFVEVQIAISWVVDNYNRVAEWYASARRVMDIVDACDASDRATAAGADAEVSQSGAIRLTDFEIADGRNRPLLSGAGFAAAPGEAVHIYGDSSTGKSTLVRVLAGLWPRARGSVSMPAPGSVMIVPQKAYLPLGSLKGALLYPHPSLEISDDRLVAALEKVGLGALAPRLAEVARWDQVLSNGERQRLAVARLAISRPGALILDDALSALDEGTQAVLLAYLRAELPEAIIISLGQRPAPLGVHDRQLVLERMGETSILRSAGMPTMAVAR
jgi:vitamin B12/bleomycin/antimicrobial peptide transport system ATP-binding/permease protein